MKKIFVLSIAACCVMFFGCIEKKQSEADIQRMVDKAAEKKVKEIEKEREMNEKLAKAEEILAAHGETTTSETTMTRPVRTSGAGNYAFVSQRLLSADELYGYSARELKIMRNEIYARHGYIFKTADMRSYFARQPWYVGRYAEVNSMLSRIEQRNIATIQSVERTK